MVLQTEQGDGEHRLYGGGIRKASFLMPNGEVRRGGDGREPQASLASPAPVEAMLAIALLCLLKTFL